MKLLARTILVLVFALAVFCAVVLAVHVWSLRQPEIRYADTAVREEAVPVNGATNLSRLGLLPQWFASKQLVAVMIENHDEARPHQQGLDEALFVGEFFVEGFISRFIAFFDAEDLPPRVGPVRSLRPYFVEAALPWTSVFFHIGGSPEALERTERDETVTAFNGVYVDTAFERVEGIPAPHDAFLTRASMQGLLRETQNLHAVRWPPYKTGRAPAGTGATAIALTFYSPLHDVEYAYDSWHRHYVRTNGREMSAATPSNVLILEAAVEEVGPFGRLAVDMEGEGDALLFRSGRVYAGRWSKEGEKEPYVFSDTEGRPLVFAAGQTWMTVVNSLGRVEWKE